MPLELPIEAVLKRWTVLSWACVPLTGLVSTSAAFYSVYTVNGTVIRFFKVTPQNHKLGSQSVKPPFPPINELISSTAATSLAGVYLVYLPKRWLSID